MLYNDLADKMKNLLPQDGIVNYHGRIFDTIEASYCFERLMETIAWRHDELVIYGKSITTKRKVAWYGDQPYRYTYSNTTKEALPWTKELLEIKQKVELESRETFNSCLLNLYHHGDEGMAWHCDDEKELKPNSAIASVSFGVERKFVFKHKKTSEKVEIRLETGSLLVMKGITQSCWLHQLPPTKIVSKARINLTFRTFVGY